MPRFLEVRHRIWETGRLANLNGAGLAHDGFDDIRGDADDGRCGVVERSDFGAVLFDDGRGGEVGGVVVEGGDADVGGVGDAEDGAELVADFDIAEADGGGVLDDDAGAAVFFEVGGHVGGFGEGVTGIEGDGEVFEDEVSDGHFGEAEDEDGGAGRSLRRCC